MSSLSDEMIDSAEYIGKRLKEFGFNRKMLVEAVPWVKLKDANLLFDGMPPEKMSLPELTALHFVLAAIEQWDLLPVQPRSRTRGIFRMAADLAYCRCRIKGLLELAPELTAQAANQDLNMKALYEIRTAP